MKKILLLAIIFFPMVLLAQTTNYGNNKVGKYAPVRGLRMYYEEYGKGEPLLFIHGNGGSIADFKGQIPYFAEKYRVVVADSRAQGKSFDPRDSLSYEMMADDYAALLSHLGIDSCRIVGWSDGGINALLLALRHPEKVSSMAITGANLWPDTSAVDNEIHDMVKMMNDSLAKVPQTKDVKAFRKLSRLLSYEPHIKTGQLSTIQCPVLVIGGDNDVIKPEHTLLIAKSIPRSYLWILPNSGHSTPVVYKDMFNAVVADFFAKPYKKFVGEDKFK